MFLLGGGRATDIFVVVGGASSVKSRGVGMFNFVFKVEVDG